MSSRERKGNDLDLHLLHHCSDGEPGTEETLASRSTADELLEAGDRAIRNALSANSEGFLRFNRQQSGQ